jgi:competence protein ComEC
VLHFVTEKLKSKTATYQRLEDALAVRNLVAKYLISGDRIDFSDKTDILTLWPEKNWLEIQQLQAQNSKNDSQNIDVNGFSLIQVLSYGKFKVLLTGDAGSLVEDKIAAEVGKIDILKVPHHGSKTGMSDYFLSQINPLLAIISVGASNKYGHPAKTTLNLLEQHNIKYFRTDKDGAIEIISDGQTFNVVN